MSLQRQLAQTGAGICRMSILFLRLHQLHTLGLLEKLSIDWLYNRMDFTMGYWSRIRMSEELGSDGLQPFHKKKFEWLAAFLGVATQRKEMEDGKA